MGSLIGQSAAYEESKLETLKKKGVDINGSINLLAAAVNGKASSNMKKER